MALANSQRDREFTNFKDNGDGTTSRYVWVGNPGGGSSAPTGSILFGILWDSYSATKPDSVTEVYAFYYQAVLAATVTIVYEDSTKEFAPSVTLVVP